MWHHYWQNLSLKACLLTTAWLFCFSIQAVELENTQGIIEGLEKLIELYQQKAEILSKQVTPDTEALNNPEVVKTMTLEPDFVLSALFETPPLYLSLIKNNKCQFYALLKNDLLKTDRGLIQKVMIKVKEPEKEQSTYSLPLDDFMDLVIRQECPNFADLDEKLLVKNLKTTFAKLDWKPPLNRPSCEKKHEEFLSNTLTPFLCGLNQKISDIGKLQTQILRTPDSSSIFKNQLREKLSQYNLLKAQLTDESITQLDHHCRNLNKLENYCDLYLSKSIWTELKGESKSSYLDYSCKIKQNKEKLSLSDYKKCALSFATETEQCLFNGAQFYPALFPRPNCDQISTAIKSSIIEANYKDCPGRQGQQGITNFFRVHAHLFNKKYESSAKNCITNTNQVFAQEQFKNENKKNWGIKICYFDKIKKERICYPTILGDIPGSEYSESAIIERIMKRSLSTATGIKCRIINEQEYNPAILEYRTGCNLIYDPKNCTGLKCPKKIIFNEKEYTFIDYEGEAKFDYFPNSLRDKRFSMQLAFTEGLKRKERKIDNLTILKVELKNYPTTIFHGLGCAESLLPRFFPIHSLNQCTPLPFIVDGYLEKENKTFLVMRTSIDDIHGPRIVPWTQIFTAVKSYQAIHPLKNWNFYAVR